MQEQLFIDYKDYSKEKVLLGLSGGINSMAVLVWLASTPEEYKPAELHLLYHHFEEHSPDTLPFVLAGVEFARANFKKVIYSQSDNSIIDFFEKQKMLPHPAYSPCSRLLKLEPTYQYMAEHGITANLVGYVNTEVRRIRRMAKRTNSPIHKVTDKGISIDFTIADFTDEWCFEVVDKHIGWHPKIYDILDKNGKRVFTHNNCLPCKNMDVKDIEQVKKYYPEYFEKAHQLTTRLNRHWGRNAETYYTTFGRPDYEKTVCGVCSF